MQNLIAWKKWKSDFDLAHVLCQTYAGEIQIIKRHTQVEYTQLVDNLERSLKVLEEEIQENSAKINPNLESTAFKSLTNTTSSLLVICSIGASLNSIAPSDSSQPALTRVSDGAQLLICLL